ncbi:MAG: hypothetical protein CMB80_34290 [Flammeovirgaceae bacterium]|nr:hypothetical protein [Flammeovirgaceae bacterium]MBR10420.1 hypothetical protein [Rickettsiales bacterium]HCX23804.1 hypothetical protein [Cytophagales bacterium]|tara:strand:- start:3370 stop:4125 length:756 start_codon:yes stop_codon:yes gene_type:complete
MSSRFDFHRFLRLLKLELFQSRKGIAMVFIITFGVLFFVGFILSLFVERPAEYDHTDSYVGALLIGGFIVSSLAFSGIDRQLKRIGFLMLPVSALERLVCAWLLTCIGWVLAYSIGFVVYVMIANPVGQVFFPDTSFKSFDVMGSAAMMAIKAYVVLQGLFLVGAAHFRGYVFPKTMVVLIGILTIVGFVIFFVLKDEFTSEHYCTVTGECELVDAFAVHPVYYVAKWLFWLVLAPLAWLLTYFGLKDQDA